MPCGAERDAGSRTAERRCGAHSKGGSTARLVLGDERSIAAPTLAVFAERGVASEGSVKRIFPTQYLRLPGTAHFLMMEKPQEFNRLLSEFASRLKY